MPRRGLLLGALLVLVALAVPALMTGGAAAPTPGAAARARVVALGAQVNALDGRLAPCASAAAARRRASAARRAALRNVLAVTPAVARARAVTLSRALTGLVAARRRCATAPRGRGPVAGPQVTGPTPVTAPPAAGPGAGPVIGLPGPPPEAGAPPPLGAPAPPPAPGTPVLQIDADPTGALRFVQSSLTAAPGPLALTLANAGPGLHTLAIKGNGVAAGPTANVPSGGSATLSVDLPPGTYTFYCTRPGHEAAGMTGTLTVG